jgi:glycerophosphoryl diester phosphodiesterase
VNVPLDPARLARTRADLARSWRVALAFHVLVQAAGLALVTPLVTWLGRYLVLASGERVVTNFDLAAFALSPGGAAFVLLIAAASLGFVLAELAGHTWIAGHAIGGRTATLASTLAAVMRRLPRLLELAARVFVRLLVLALPFLLVAGALAWSTLREHDVNYYLAERPPEWRRALLVAGLMGAIYVALAVRLLAGWLYAVPILMFEAASPRRALADSARLTRGRLVPLVVPLVLWWLLVTCIAIAIAWAASFVSDAALDWAGIAVRRVLPLVGTFVVVALLGGLLYGAVQFAGHQFLVTRTYAEQVDANARALAAVPEREARRLVLPIVGAVAAALALSFAGLLYVATRLDLERPVAVTAHRGASMAAPENTMAAFRAAMAAGADYAELDVQLTRDRRVAVLHDADLMRMGGEPRRVAASTLAELQTVDVGRRTGAALAGERVPALEDVIDAVRGRMKLNVELKYNVPDPELAPAVVELLRREDFLDDVVITSLDYAALRQVRALEPRLRTGHIVTAGIGDLTRSQADFLSLNAARATPLLIRRARAAGKQVHVWTVNDPDVMLRMIERGVDNVITDDPATFARVVAERRELGRAELLGLRLRVLFDRPPPALNDPAAVEPL